MDQDAIRAQLDRLRARFAAELPQRLAEADALLAALRAGDGQALAGLRMIVHRLHGTGGTMGFAELSAAAAALELRLDACLQAGGAGPEDVAAVAAGLSALKAAAARA